MAQTYLQVENMRAGITQRLQAGDEITFILNNDSQPYTGSIMRINSDERTLQLNGWVVFIDSIQAVRSNRDRAIRPIGNYMRYAGAVALVNSLLSGLFFKASNVKEFALISGGLAATGQTLMLAGKKRKWYRKKAGYRLRVIDLHFYSQ